VVAVVALIMVGPQVAVVRAAAVLARIPILMVRLALQILAVAVVLLVHHQALAQMVATVAAVSS